MLAKDSPSTSVLASCRARPSWFRRLRSTASPHVRRGGRPSRERIGEAAAALLEGCDLTVTVDHHAVDSTMTDLVYVDPDAASTTMLVWELAGLLGAERAGDVAQCCYTGLVTDTGRFQYQNTDAAAMRAASEMVEAGADRRRCRAPSSRTGRCRPCGSRA
ncbi:MAG: DHH family phosphoesterase [Eggerthellaceae bacterium]